MIRGTKDAIESSLLTRAITTLICALAHDEASRCNAVKGELAGLREHWVPDAEAIVEDAERRGLFGGEYNDQN